MALSGESSLRLARWGTRYRRLDGLGSWTGYIGLDWAFHIVSFGVTHGRTVYITGLNRAGDSILHVANLRLARSLAQSLAQSLARSLASHQRGLGLARSLALHLGGFRLGWGLAFHCCRLGLAGSLARHLAHHLGNLNWAWCRALHNLHLTRDHHLAWSTGRGGGAEGGPLYTALEGWQAILKRLLVTHGSNADG